MNAIPLKQPLTSLKPYFPLIVSAVVYFLAMNLFEAGQQLYYIKRFSLAQDAVSYFALLKGHILRWGIWLIITLPFIHFILRNRITQSTFTLSFLAKYLFFIFSSLFLTISCISVVQMWQDGAVLAEFIEYVQFFTAQKFALFFSGYLGAVILVHLYIKQAEFEGQLYELLALKEKYQVVSAELKSHQKQVPNDLISIKIGDKVKIIPLSEIVWVQSADYCVQIHTKNNRSYLLRQSMKAMESQLSAKGFIRIHRNSIINLKAVATFRFNGQPSVILKSGISLPIANSRISKVRALTKGMKF